MRKPGATSMQRIPACRSRPARYVCACRHPPSIVSSFNPPVLYVQTSTLTCKTLGESSCEDWVNLTRRFAIQCPLHLPDCQHAWADCGNPPTITNDSGKRSCGYFQNRFGEQWGFVYDYAQKTGELRGGDLGRETV